MRSSNITGLAIALAGLLCAGTPALAQDDQVGGKDHPLFSRWPGYYIDSYKHTDFDAYTYALKDRKETVEGDLHVINYCVKRGNKAASELAIIRNYENAIRKAGGTVLFTDGTEATIGKIVQGGKEIWVRAAPWNQGDCVELNITERRGMEQNIQANAAVWRSDIASTGRAAVYGVFFDTDRAEIKPESEPALAEMAKLLKENATLNVHIVGHTDNSGTVERNIKLSQDRAAAVVNALVSRHGIAAARLKAHGVASLAPVASNRSEDGKAKNRRVELVER